MAYDFVRWGVGIVIFIAVSLILIKVTKNKGKSILIASFSAIISVALLLLVPVENFFYGFPTVEKVYSYRYHEKLLSYAECDAGALCIGQKDDNNFVYYSFEKEDGKYKLPTLNSDDTVFRSSKFGIYMFKEFENGVLIVTQAKNSCYDGVPFKECTGGYYYCFGVTDDILNCGLITCEGEQVTLV